MSEPTDILRHTGGTSRRFESQADAGETTGAEQASLLAELAGADHTEPGSASAPRRVVSTQTLLIVGVLVASAAVLLGMRRYGMGAGLRFSTVEIDYALDDVSGDRLADHQRVLAVLARSGAPAQIPAFRIQKNPFELIVVRGQTEAGADASTRAEQRAEELRRQREEAIRTALRTISVQAVMNGPVPVARVNGRILRVGDRLDDMFTIAAIEERGVVLEADGQRYTVYLGGSERSVPISPRRDRRPR